MLSFSYKELLGKFKIESRMTVNDFAVVVFFVSIPWRFFSRKKIETSSVALVLFVLMFC